MKELLANQFINRTTDSNNEIAIIDNCTAEMSLTITYEQLGKIVNSMSEIIKTSLGNQCSQIKSKTVSLLLDEGMVVPITELATLFIENLKFVAVDPVLPSDRVSFLLSNSDTNNGGVIITTVSYYNLHKETLFNSSENASFTILVVESIPDKGIILNLEYSSTVTRTDKSVSINVFKQLYNTEGGVLLIDINGADTSVGILKFTTAIRQTLPDCQSPKKSNDDLYIVYTSGSTGIPKGILGSGLGLASYLQLTEVDSEAEGYFISPMVSKKKGDRVLMCSAVSWDPSVSDIFSTLLNGATLVLEPRARVMNDLRGCIEQNEVTHLFATPALWRLLFDGILENISTSQMKSLYLKSLQSICLGGEPWGTAYYQPMDVVSLQNTASDVSLIRSSSILIPDHLLECYNVYGVTECTVVQFTSVNLMLYKKQDCTLEKRHKDLQYGHKWIRHLFPNSMFAIVPPEKDEFSSSEIITTEQSGELVLAGPQVLIYHGDGLLQQGKYFNTLSPDVVPIGVPVNNQTLKWFRTGDKVIRGGQNSISILGRLDRQVKINGYRVELSEVEDIVEQVGTCRGCGEKLIRIFCNLFPDTTSTITEVANRLIASVFVQTPTPPCSECVSLFDTFIQFSDFSIILHAWCESQMPRHQVPHLFLYMNDSFPNGVPAAVSGMKIDLNKIKEVTGNLYKQSGSPSHSHTNSSSVQKALLNPTEDWVRTVWSEVLNIRMNDIDSKSHFFELGGDSPKAIVMVNRLKKKSSDGIEENAELTHRKLCGLLRKPRLKEYASFLDWVYYRDTSTSSVKCDDSQNNHGDNSSLKVSSIPLKELICQMHFPSTEIEILYKAISISDVFSVISLLKTGRVDTLFGGRAVIEFSGQPQENISNAKTCIKDVHAAWEEKQSQVGVKTGFRSELKKLYQNSIDFGNYDFRGKSKIAAPPPPLIFAFYFGNLTIVETLLGEIKTILESNTSTVQLLLKDILTWSNHMGMTGLMISARYAENTSVSFYKRLIEHYGALLQPKDTNQWSLFFHLTAACKTSAVSYMLDSVLNADKTSPFFKVNFLTQFDRWGNPPLLYAVQSGSVELCSVLIKHGASQQFSQKYSHLNVKLPQRAHRRRNNIIHWETPLHYAVKNGYTEIIKLLLAHGCIIKDNRDVDSQTALHRAVISEDVMIVKLLIDSKTGFDSVNEIDNDLRSALFYARTSDVRDLLIRNGADVVLCDRNGLSYMEYSDSVKNINLNSSSTTIEHRNEFQTKGRFQIEVDIAADSEKNKKKTKQTDMWDKCFRCWQSGHTSKNCSNNPMCKLCNGPHESKDHGKVYLPENC